MVSVTVVTFNSAQYIAECLASVLAQQYQPKEVIVVDNGSGDPTPAILREFEGRVRVIFNPENTGFAAAQNQAIAMAEGAWVLVLNPDVKLQPSFISSVVAAGEADASVGSVCGKLLRMSPDFSVLKEPRLDSTGIYFTPAMRHFDRGSDDLDDGRYEQCEYVFGATGAAALYRRRMIEDVSIAGEFFDADFFAYREDADVAWRSQLLGWKCVYTPHAVGYHVRAVLPRNRAAIAPVLNMHSVKNRWLMRIKNMTSGVFRRTWLAASLRDAAVIAGCLLREFSSLRAFPYVIRNLRRFLKKRREIMARCRVSDRSIAAWFSHGPVSYPAPGIAPAVLAIQADKQMAELGT